MRNFAYPYFSRDIGEFWRRWHISLSTWFRDYLYIPLGGSKVNRSKKIRNTLIIFIVSGFWHGANWTFVIWRALNALYIIPSVFMNTNRKNIDIVAQNSILPSIREFFAIILTFSLTCFAWIFFRAENTVKAFDYISGIFTGSFFSLPAVGIKLFIIIIFFVIMEWNRRREQYALEKFGFKLSKSLRWGVYAIFALIIFYFSGNEQQFIYFQF